MAQTLFTFFGWNANYAYEKYDVVLAGASNTTYFYGTTASFGANPAARFYYTPTLGTRRDEVMRLSFTQTGTTYFQPGSILIVSGLAPDTANYTGICLGAGSGYVEYLNPGLNVSNAVTNGVVYAPIHPSWTTGFYWIPSWTSEVNHKQAVMGAQMGENYSQRYSSAINSNSFAWNLVFENRTDKETKALSNFLQNMGGIAPFQINFPVGKLYNTPNLQYVAGPVRHGLTSYGINAITVEVQQVFDL